MKAAAADPERVLCVAELDPSHSLQLQTTLDHPTRLLFNNFIDEMFTQLAKPYLTEANETVYIKASRATVTNIAQCFAQARLLDVNLAKRTRADFVEPECLLTITVPTGLPPKDTYKGEFAGTYVSYHKTSWESVAKILTENCVRPASWTKNDPCYGFFGYSCEITDPDDLKLWPIRVCTSNLYKIGKGQNPSGILATCRCPKLIKAQSGGNDQIQRLCAFQGIAKGKNGATAMNSKCASVSYRASTHQVFPQLITKAPIPNCGSTSSVAGDPPEPSTSNTTPPPNTEATTIDTAPTPNTATHHRARVPDDRSSHPGTSEPHHRATIGNPTLPGTEMPVIAVIIHLPTVRDAPGIIIVKDPRDTTPQTVMQNAHLGDHYIQDLHF